MECREVYNTLMSPKVPLHPCTAPTNIAKKSAFRYGIRKTNNSNINIFKIDPKIVPTRVLPSYRFRNPLETSGRVCEAFLQHFSPKS